MVRDELVASLTDESRSRDVTIGSQHPPAPRHIGEGAKNSFGAVIDRAFGRHKLDGALPSCLADSWKAGGFFLRCREVYAASRYCAPSGHPETAELTVGVEKNQRTLWDYVRSQVFFIKRHARFSASSSSSVRGQSDRNSRDKLRSARSFPPVWQRAQ